MPNDAPAFYNHFEAIFKDHAEATRDIEHVVGEGELAVVHSLSRTGPQDRGQAITDLLRAQHGKIVEHWKVIQPVPAQTEPAASDLPDHAVFNNPRSDGA